jgi:signal transduction histidine kinase
VFHPGASLRTVVGTFVAVVGALALVTTAALVFLTTELRRAGDEHRAVIVSLRLAQEAETNLLLHALIDDPLARRQFERDLRDKLEGAREFATSDVARAAHRPAHDRVEAYLASSDAAGRTTALDAAFGALEEFVATNVRQSHAADARARSLDRFADLLGTGTAVVLVLSAAWLLWWLRSRAFEPLLTIADAMKRFGSGESGARAPSAGPAELRAMARHFNDMAATLAALRERQMTFLAALAHELRNPLSALKLATARGPAADGEDAGDARLVLVRRQVLRLERLVTDFLDTARIEAGQLEVNQEPVDLRWIVQNVVSLFGATSTAHRITVQLPDEQAIAACDPGRIEQVLNNLVSNAIKYSPNGGRIALVVAPRRDAVTVSVADEGIGISEGEIDAIFEPFRRGLGVQRDIPGAGLGLYVSKRIVEAHGGHIHVTSSPGRGSTFEVVLPTWRG